MSESNAMPIAVDPRIYGNPVYLRGLLERVKRVYFERDWKSVERLFEAEIEEMETRIPESEQRVQELEAALRELLDEHCCDDGGVDYKGTAEECLTCIPARRVLSKGAQPKEEA